MGFIYQWIDIVWLLLVLLAVHKPHRWLAAGFVLSGMVMLRLLVELMESTGYTQGFLPFLSAPLFMRGQIVYGVFYVIFMIMAYYSRGAERSIFLAGAISLFFAASVTALFVMVL